MKTLKFEHSQAEQIASGEKTSTWRVDNDKNLSVNDEVRLIDKIDPERPETWRVFGVARIDRVIEKRLGDITAEDMEGHERYDSTDEMIAHFKTYYGNDVTPTTPIKLISFKFSSVEQGGNPSFTTMVVDNVKVFADGGSRGNPGPSASGYVIVDAGSDKVLVDKGVYLGVTTNNQAEYLALKYALEECLKMGVKTVDAYMDSLLVVNQIKGTFKVKNRDLYPIHDSVKELIARFEKFNLQHVPREMNKLADAAVNRAMDEALDGQPPAPGGE
jgi:ribonuclease HI